MIEHLIPPSALDLIPPKIYTILDSEFTNQLDVYGNTACQGVKFMADRTVPLDKVETDMIEISLFKGDMGIGFQGGEHWDYVFALEIITKAKTTASKRGDQSAAERLKKLIGIVRYILMNPQYNTLDLTGIVERTGLLKFQVYKEDRTDAAGIATVQMLFGVLCEEISNPNLPVLLAQSNTNVLIALSSQGYEYQKS